MEDFKRYKIETKSVKQKRKVVELFEQLGYRDFSTAGVHLKLITYEDGDIQSVVDFGWATSAFESITVSELKALVSAKQQHTEDTHMKQYHIQCSDLHERAEVIEMLESIGCHSSLVNSDHLALRVHDRGTIQTVVDFVCAERDGSTLITVNELREMTGFDTTLSAVKHYLDGGDIQVKIHLVHGRTLVGILTYGHYVKVQRFVSNLHLLKLMEKSLTNNQQSIILIPLTKEKRYESC